MGFTTVDRRRALKFAGKEIAKGALQATGSILIYVIVLWAIYSNFFSLKDRNTLDTALRLKAPGMSRVVDNQAFPTSAREREEQRR